MTATQAPARKRPARWRGRWTHNSDSTMYGEAGLPKTKRRRRHDPGYPGTRHRRQERGLTDAR